MGKQEDPLVSVHDVLGFLPDFDSLSDPQRWIKEAVRIWLEAQDVVYVCFQPMSLFKNI